MSPLSSSERSLYQLSKYSMSLIHESLKRIMQIMTKYAKSIDIQKSCTYISRK